MEAELDTEVEAGLSSTRTSNVLDEVEQTTTTSSGNEKVTVQAESTSTTTSMTRAGALTEKFSNEPITTPARPDPALPGAHTLSSRANTHPDSNAAVSMRSSYVIRSVSFPSAVPGYVQAPIQSYYSSSTIHRSQGKVATQQDQKAPQLAEDARTVVLVCPERRRPVLFTF